MASASDCRAAGTERGDPAQDPKAYRNINKKINILRNEYRYDTT